MIAANTHFCFVPVVKVKGCDTDCLIGTEEIFVMMSNVHYLHLSVSVKKIFRHCIYFVERTANAMNKF